MKQKNWLALTLALLCIVATISGCSRESKVPAEHEATVMAPETTHPVAAEYPSWMNNILRSDEIPEDFDDVLNTYPVFGSDYQRNQIISVTILDTLADLPEDAWDVSEAGNGSVMAWVEPNGGLYDLYIGGEGGVSVGSSCAYLFAGYQNALSITLGDHFATYDAVDMQSMFHYCQSLTELILGRHFDTSNAQDMESMFQFCEVLADLDLGDHFDTSNVQNMRYMFFWCATLTELNLGDKFVTANADTTDIFKNCPAGDAYQHLLN